MHAPRASKETIPSPEFQRLLGRLADTRLRLLLLRGLALSWTVAGLGGALLLACLLVELALRPGPLARFVLVRCLALPGLLLAALVLARRWLRGVDLRAVACRVQAASPALGRRLEGALDLHFRGERSPLALAALGQVAREADACDFRVALGFGRRARRLLLSPLAALGACGLIFLFSPGRAGNALARLLAPYQVEAVVGAARITSLTPGRDVEVVEGADLEINVGVDRPDKVRRAVIVVGQDERRLARAGRGAFMYRLRDLRRDQLYHIEIGGSRSRTFRVRVLARPAVTAITGVVHPPAYTGLAAHALPGNGGAIRAPAGSRVHLRVETNHAVTRAGVRLSSGAEFPLLAGTRGLETDIEINASGTYAVSLLDARGHANTNPVARPIECLPDNLPRPLLLKPEKNLRVGLGTVVLVVVQVRDDFGVKEVTLFFRRNRRGEAQVLKRWQVAGGNVRKVTLPCELSVAGSTFDVGDEVALYAQATDFGPGKRRAGRSPVRYLKVIDPGRVARREVTRLEKVKRLLAAVLAAEKRVHRATGALRPAAKAFPVLAAGLGRRQGNLRGRVADAAGMLVDLENRVARRIRVVLMGLAANELAKATGALARAARTTTIAARRGCVVEAIPAQAAAIKRLGQILGIIPKLQEQAQGSPDKEEGTDLPAEALEKLRKLKQDLERFKNDQRKVVDATRDLNKRNVDDFTAADQRKLEELKALEENWANLLRDTYSDLSKVPKQDFSNPTLLGEVLAVFEEVELAAGAMTRKEVEIATAAASTGMELAESLTTHLEKWLPDKPDRVAWKMEEPLSDYEVPMAELPEKLEDIVGELTEQEEELMNEADDASSSWADSLDQGAGWDAMDGPISNYSAQGVTGNQLPNTSEIGGRAGEGRQGKSHGEMVSDTAVGKGGRKTPSRLTPDSFEQGEIKDQAKEASGGATGGGKGGAAGDEGLEGPPPPPDKGPLARLRGKQAELRNKAERLQLNLKLMGYNNAILENTLARMRSVESELKSGRYRSASRQAHYVIDNLKTARDAILGEATVRADSSAALPRELQRQIMDALDAGLPKGYEDLVKAYYEKLAAGEAR